MEIKEMMMILQDRSLADLEELMDVMNSSHAQELADCAEGYAIWLLRAARYIESRKYYMQDHKTAMKAQNKVAEKIRKALGYSYPKQDITF